jgi:type II secretory pathway component PulF
MGSELPLPTRILIAITNFIGQFWWILLLILVGGFYAYSMWRKTLVGRRMIDAFIFKIPIIGILQEKIIMTGVTRTLAMLVGNGVSIIESLHIVAEASDNLLVEEAINTSASEVEKGIPLSSSLAKYEFFPPIVAKMVSVGEETGKLSEVLLRVSNHFEEESDLALKALTTAIEPAMIILLGIGVFFIVIAVMMPIYNMTTGI